MQWNDGMRLKKTGGETVNPIFVERRIYVTMPPHHGPKAGQGLIALCSLLSEKVTLISNDNRRKLSREVPVKWGVWKSGELPKVAFCSVSPGLVCA